MFGFLILIQEAGASDFRSGWGLRYFHFEELRGGEECEGCWVFWFLVLIFDLSKR